MNCVMCCAQTTVVSLTLTNFVTWKDYSRPERNKRIGLVKLGTIPIHIVRTEMGIGCGQSDSFRYFLTIKTVLLFWKWMSLVTRHTTNIILRCPSSGSVSIQPCD